MMKWGWLTMKIARIGLLLLLGLYVWMGGGNSVLQAAPANPYAVAGIENAAEFEKVFAALQKVVAVNDRSKVADLVLYPLRVNGWTDDVKGKGSVQFETKAELLDNYDEIFTLQVREAIVGQKVAELFVNWQGVMVGKGEVWLSASDKKPGRYGIFAVNLVNLLQ